MYIYVYKSMYIYIRAVKNSALTTLIRCLLLITSIFLTHFTHAQCDKLFRSGKWLGARGEMEQGEQSGPIDGFKYKRMMMVQLTSTRLFARFVTRSFNFTGAVQA